MNILTITTIGETLKYWKEVLGEHLKGKKGSSWRIKAAAGPRGKGVTTELGTSDLHAYDGASGCGEAEKGCDSSRKRRM